MIPLINLLCPIFLFAVICLNSQTDSTKQLDRKYLWPHFQLNETYETSKRLTFDAKEATGHDIQIEKAFIELDRLKSNRQIIIYVAIVTCILIVSFLAFVLAIHSRSKSSSLNNMAALAQENQRLLEEVDISASTYDALTKAVTSKVKELTTSTFFMIQKGELLHAVKGEIASADASSEQDAATRLSKLSSKISFTITSERNWELFRTQFEKMHPRFFSLLSLSFPNLNGNDLKMCAFIKSNLSVKEIATFMDISPDSAKVARHRLKKKLNLNSDQDLGEYLMDFKPLIEKVKRSTNN